MKHIKKIFAIALAAVMLLTCVPSAFAATSETAVIDDAADCSLTIYAFDWTNAYKDGVVDEDTFVSSGWQDSVVEDTFINSTPIGGTPEQVLGNSQTSNGYAVKGVEYTIAHIAHPLFVLETMGEPSNGYFQVQMLYGFPKDYETADFIVAIGLDGSTEYQPSDKYSDLPENYYLYTSDVIIDALATALENNATQVKNALEKYVNTHGIQMPLTDEDGRTSLDGLDVGLYLVVETAVPEMVTNTTNPFLISLPMTTVNNNTEGTAPEAGHEWNYDVTVYPKSFSGIPTLEKTVRESKEDSGSNYGTDKLYDHFEHNATGSAGDTMEFQFVSTLPTITSASTALTCYNFFDTMEDGMTYNKDVKIEIFSDKQGESLVTTWTQDSGKFTVTYSEDGQSMTVDITESGLAEINGDTTNKNGALYAGYSNYTMRVSYSAEIDSDASFTYGADGNCNKVVLTWKRTSSEYYDTLIDDAHVFSFGLNLTKLFSDLSSENAEAEGLYEYVKFVVKNNKHDYWLTAELNEAEGIYYVNGFTSNEEEATVFTPVTSDDEFGKVIIRGVEDDGYLIYETETADGYTLLDNYIWVGVTMYENHDVLCDIYSEDVLGVLQNDPRYAFSGEGVDALTNIPQKQLAHYGIVASATIEGNEVMMRPVGDSQYADAPVTIINTRGFDLPETGDQGVWMYGVAGGTLMLAAVLVILFAFKKKEDQQTMKQ